ncbi:MAG: heme-binding protein [Planctomycetota bacterium]
MSRTPGSIARLTSTLRLAATAAACSGAVAIAQTSGTTTSVADRGTDQDASATVATPMRVGGEAAFEIQTRTAIVEDGEEGTVYVAGPMRTTAVLPEGYPRPTPAGAIEIKSYPSVRRAELTVENTPRRAASQAFMPLFMHIKDRNIAMTAPVENDMPAMAQAIDQLGEPAADRSMRGDVTVSFLYRTEDLGPVGEAERGVRVVDAPPVTVISVGIRGVADDEMIRERTDRLYRWLRTQGSTNYGPDGSMAPGRWVPAGPPRWLGYNGPTMPARDRWAEAQVPIRWEAGES